MLKLRIRFVGTDIHRDVEVDDLTAESIAAQLGDPGAVLKFTDKNGVHYIPVRNISYVTASPR